MFLTRWRCSAAPRLPAQGVVRLTCGTLCYCCFVGGRGAYPCKQSRGVVGLLRVDRASWVWPRSSSNFQALRQPPQDIGCVWCAVQGAFERRHVLRRQFSGSLARLVVRVFMYFVLRLAETGVWNAAAVASVRTCV